MKELREIKKELLICITGSPNVTQALRSPASHLQHPSLAKILPHPKTHLGSVTSTKTSTKELHVRWIVIITTRAAVMCVCPHLNFPAKAGNSRMKLAPQRDFYCFTSCMSVRLDHPTFHVQSQSISLITASMMFEINIELIVENYDVPLKYLVQYSGHMQLVIYIKA